MKNSVDQWPGGPFTRAAAGWRRSSWDHRVNLAFPSRRRGRMSKGAGVISLFHGWWCTILVHASACLTTRECWIYDDLPIKQVASRYVASPQQGDRKW